MDDLTPYRNRLLQTLVIPSGRKYLIAPMAYRVTKLNGVVDGLRSRIGRLVPDRAIMVVRQWPRRCVANVKTMGGRRSVIDAASVPAEKPNRRSSERYQALERSKSNITAR
jgi:hypothetical protein